jgi:hypothetical protein
MVGSRSHLRDDASERRMHRCLTRNTFGKHLTAAAHERDRTLIAT